MGQPVHLQKIVTFKVEAFIKKNNEHFCKKDLLEANKVLDFRVAWCSAFGTCDIESAIGKLYYINSI